VAGGLLALAAHVGMAQTASEPAAEPAAGAVSAADPAASAPQGGAPPSPAAKPSRSDKFEGAIGLTLRYGATFGGASDTKLKPGLAGFVRWGRITVSGSGGFTTKHKDDVDRGLSADLMRKEKFRLGLALRVSSGRSESDSPLLAGMGDIRSTLRTQLSARWTPVRDWHLGLSVNTDALNRGGGYHVTGSVSRTWPLGPTQRLIASASLTGAGDRFMQTWHGVTEAQALRSGYPEFHPGEGLRDIELGLTWRVELSERWAGFVGISHTEWLESARRSPLTTEPSSQMLSGGLAWRF
jgi:outer membrane scaffolding protein for murein synthesis (MipA/OmpV family)